ncbi:MAG TPA: hypothetical protein VGN08_04980 [Solirubrobacteraceae bacterium]|jgi:hypothetical protein
MNIRIRATLVAIFSFASLASMGSAAQANLLSILPGSCGSQPESQPFARWGDTHNYFLATGGTFEAGAFPWLLWSGASVGAGNESYYANAATDRSSLSLPSGSSATSPAVCTSIYQPTVRLFVKNTGSTSSRLRVEALYPGLLWGVQVARLGDLSGSSTWQPSPELGLTVTNLLATLSLQQTAIAYRFTPEDSSGQWRIDDVYVDPRMR